jgi:hypothetical protein
MMTSRSLICLLENQNGGRLQKGPLNTKARGCLGNNKFTYILKNGK